MGFKEIITFFKKKLKNGGSLSFKGLWSCFYKKNNLISCWVNYRKSSLELILPAGIRIIIFILIFFTLQDHSFCMDTERDLTEQIEQQNREMHLRQAYNERQAYLQRLYTEGTPETRQTLARQIIDLFRDNPPLEQVLDVNGREPMSGLERIESYRSYYAFFLWLSMSLILFLVVHYGFDFFEFMHHLVYATPQLVLNLTPHDFGLLLHRAGENPVVRDRVLEFFNRPQAS